MVTKWKDKVKIFGRKLKEKKRQIIGIAGTAGGCYFIYVMVMYRSYHPTEEALLLAIMGNILLCIGMKYILQSYLQRKYGNWEMKGEFFYKQWKEETGRIQKKFFWGGLGAFLFASVTYWSHLISRWYGNLAAGYLLVITVLLQFIGIQWVFWKFMNEKLQNFMEHLEQMNQQQLAHALEIERKSLEKVSRSDQLRVDLITNVSHDLKTPLTSIVGYLELLKKEPLNDVALDYVEVLFQRSEKLKEMIESLFSLAKASSGNIELHLEQMDMNRLLNQIVADLKDKIQDSGLHMVLHLTEEDTTLISDNMYCYRIIQNLMENALKYSAQGTRVFIKSFVKGDHLIGVELTNTAGYLMDFEKEDIMERFSRGDKSRSTEGNGLGLAIVSSYAKALGGEFDIQVDCDQFKATVLLPKKKQVEA